MFKRSEAVLLVIVSFITLTLKSANSYDSHGDYQDQMRYYLDSLYERSVTEQPSRDTEPSNSIVLKMPGVHPEKVSKLF